MAGRGLERFLFGSKAKKGGGSMGIMAFKTPEYFPRIIEEPVSWGPPGNTRNAGRYKAIVDANTGKLFSIVSKGYQLIRHEEAIKKVERALGRTRDLGCAGIIETGFYNDGGRMRRTYRFTEISVEISKGDIVHPELHLFNSYDVTWPFTVLVGAFRFVCGNGLVIGRKFMQLKKRHVFELDRINLEAEISTAMKRLLLQTQEWKRWMNHQLTEPSYNKIMKAMKLGKQATEEVEKKFYQETGDRDDSGFPIITLWAFFNVLTWFITFRAVSLNHRVEMEGRLRAAMARIRNS